MPGIGGLYLPREVLLQVGIASRDDPLTVISYLALLDDVRAAGGEGESRF